MFLACMFSYMIRTNLSIIIVAMANTTSKDGINGPACSAAIATNGNSTSHKPAVLKDVRFVFFSFFNCITHICTRNKSM